MKTTQIQFAPHLPSITVQLAGDNLRLVTLDIMRGLADAGVKEQGGNNCGPFIDELLRRARVAKRNPWCMATINAAAEMGAELMKCKSPLERVKLQAYVEEHYQWARKNGILVPAAEAKPGHLVLFWTPGLKRHGHVAILERIDLKAKRIHTVEGNTTPGPGVVRDSETRDGVHYKSHPIRSTTKFVNWTSLRVWED